MRAPHPGWNSSESPDSRPSAGHSSGGLHPETPASPRGTRRARPADRRSDRRVPPSLQNIFKELSSDLNLPVPGHGDLTKWAEQGVLLLNACLTVEHGIAASHQAIGWQSFTDVVIQKLSKQKNAVVFMLWGNYAKRKKDLIDPMKHLILEAAHPSPLARGAFNGNKHFSQANTFLVLNDLSPIDFNLV